MYAILPWVIAHLGWSYLPVPTSDEASESNLYLSKRFVHTTSIYLMRALVKARECA